LNSEHIDPEVLAAFLDGTLPASERERLLRAAAKGGAAYEQLIEAQALLYEGVAAAASPRRAVSALPSATPRVASAGNESGWGRAATWRLGGLLAAASIAGILLLQRRDGQPDASPTAATVQQVMALAAGTSPDSAFGPGWDQIDWSITRGPSESMEDGVYAFRLGVRFVDLALALSSTDTLAVRTLAQTLAGMAWNAETGSPVAARVEALAEADRRPTAAELSSVGDDLRTLAAHSAVYDAAVWVESARAGARARQTGFFAPNGAPVRELRRIIAELEAMQPNEPAPATEVLQALKRVDEQSRTSAADVGAIAAMLDSTVTRGGRLVR
jgi:hypothetical protein